MDIIPATTRGPSWEDILAIAATRQADSSPLMQEIRNVRDRYNGDVVYPWAEKFGAVEDMPDLTPHMVGEAIDNYGLRAASVAPSLFCPAINPAREVGTGSREWASRRRRALAATLYANKVPLLARRYFRHIAGYATASLMVEPDFRTAMPKIRIINPLNSFPDPRSAEDYDNPIDCLYITGHSASWLRAEYPELRSEVGGPLRPNERSDELWDLIRWVDEEVMVIGLAGKRSSWDRDFASYGNIAGRTKELRRIENRMGRFPGVNMGRVTLDRLGSALTHVMGQVDWAARLQLLDVVATEKAIYPDMYVIGDGNRQPKIHTADGRWKDGRTGEINLLQNVAAVGQLRNSPDQAGKQAIDRMERNTRTSLGLAAQFGGETSNAVRSGRGVDAILGASVDPRVHEMQEIAQAWLPHLYGSVMACWEAYWPDEKRVMFSGYPGDRGHVEFKPKQLFGESKEVAVSWPIAGADLQLTNISLSQMLGTEAISLKTFRDRHPWIDDAEGESRSVNEEKLEAIAMQALTQQAISGQIPMEQLAMIEEAFKQSDNADIFSAMRTAITKLKEQQAAEAPEPQPGQVGPPELQPGLGGPSGPAPPGLPPGQAELPAPIGPTGGQEGLRELQNALAAGGRRVSGMAGPQ